MWVACQDLDGYPATVIYQAGHRRWNIENQAFNQLTQYYHLTHCYHHDPTSLLVQMLSLILGFALFTAFARHSQSVRVGEMTFKALAHHLDLALEEDLPWDQWFHSRQRCDGVRAFGKPVFDKTGREKIQRNWGQGRCRLCRRRPRARRRVGRNGRRVCLQTTPSRAEHEIRAEIPGVEKTVLPRRGVGS